MYFVRSIHEMSKVYAFDAAYELGSIVLKMKQVETMTAEEVVDVVENLQAAEIPIEEYTGETKLSGGFEIEWMPALNFFAVESHWEISTL